MSNVAFMQSSLGRKLMMGITGLFLISFLVIHCFINALIFFNDGGLTFNMGAAFMAHNWIIRAMEIVLFLGILAHIFFALMLTIKNRKARPQPYAVSGGKHNSKWYSRWMGLLGTLILIFLIVHLAHFWVKSRFTGVESIDMNGNENMYRIMATVFQEPWVVILYCLSMISLAYHLLHGFQSAFQTLGFNHIKYSPLIKTTGIAFSIIVPLIFAAMPLSMYMGWIV
ncbi:MAG: succinate dehydrogenase cytochrome b subunit [Flavobacteriales bacterium]